MENQNAWNDYYALSGKASEISRQTNYACIALIWILKKDAPGATGLTATLQGLGPSMLLALLLFFLSLATDLLQYLLQSMLTRKEIERAEKLRGPHAAVLFDAKGCRSPKRVGEILFLTKNALLLLGVLILATQLFFLVWKAFFP